MELRAWLRQQHSISHLLLDGEILPKVDDALMRCTPDGGGNSVAWLLWHVTRCEDVAVNAVIRDAPQVIVSGGWSSRPGLEDARIGTGLGDDEVAGFAESVDLEALRGYREAVKAETTSWLKTADLSVLAERPDIAARVATAGELWPDGTTWVGELWSGFNNAAFLNWVAMGHTLLHAGEMQSVMSRLGIRGR